MKIIPQNTENLLWNKLYNEYKFTPKIHGQFEWIKIPNENKTYHKDTPWTDEQEYLINSFLEELVSDEVYAFDWQNDSFLFSHSPTCVIGRLGGGYGKKTPVRVMTAFFANRQHWYLLSYVFTSLPHFLSDFGRR